MRSIWILKFWQFECGFCGYDPDSYGLGGCDTDSLRVERMDTDWPSVASTGSVYVFMTGAKLGAISSVSLFRWCREYCVEFHCFQSWPSPFLSTLIHQWNFSYAQCFHNLTLKNRKSIFKVVITTCMWWIQNFFMLFVTIENSKMPDLSKRLA